MSEVPRWVCLLDWMNEDELLAYDYGVHSTISAINRILDGLDNGSGVCSEPFESLRRRVFALKEKANEPRNPA